MTSREIFDRVKAHLLTQRIQSRLRDGMPGKYSEEAPYTARSAVGSLIRREHYHPKLESHWVFHDSVKEAVAASLGMSTDDLPLDLLSALEVTHNVVVNPWHWDEVLDKIEADHL